MAANLIDFHDDTIYNYLSVSEIKIRRTDAAHVDNNSLVLIHAFFLQGENPGPEYQARLDVGLAMFASNSMTYFAVVCGKIYDEPIAQAEAGARYLIAHGVPRKKVLALECLPQDMRAGAFDTQQEIECFAAIARNHAGPLAYVTTWMQSARSGWIFREHLSDRRITFYPAPWGLSPLRQPVRWATYLGRELFAFVCFGTPTLGRIFFPLARKKRGG